MGFEVVWTPKALQTFSDNVLYLQEKWTEREVKRFVRRVNGVLAVLPDNPHLFRRSQRVKSLHIGLVVKQDSMVYRVRDDLGKIELITFVNNHRKPKY